MSNSSDEDYYSYDSMYRHSITEVESDQIELQVRQAEQNQQPLSMDRYHEIIRDLLKRVPVYGYAPYDPKYGDDRMCKCGHPYYRHFDTYDNMAPVGCKYCNHYDECQRFEEATDV